MSKAEEYLRDIGLENVIDEEFFNDEDKSYYTVQELMEAYHKSRVNAISDELSKGVNEALYEMYSHGEMGSSANVTDKIADDCLNKIKEQLLKQ